MQLIDLRTLLTRLLDEDGIFRTTDVLNMTLNASYQTTAIMSQGCELTSQFILGANEMFKFMNQDFFVPVSIWMGTTRLYPIRSADLDFLTDDWMSADPGTPAYYFLHGSLTRNPTVWIYPRPTVSTTFRLTYAAVPAKMTQDTDIPRIPAEHHYTIVLLSYAWELLKERGQIYAGKALRTFQDFVRDLNMLQQTVYNRNPDRDWLMMPWDAEAMKRKLHSFENPVPPVQSLEGGQLAQ